MNRPRSRAFPIVIALTLLVSVLAAAAVAPSPAAAAGTISIRIHNCPSDYAGAQATIYQLAATCHDPGAGLQVTLTSNHNPVSTMTADGNGWLTFANFQTGNEAELTEAAPLGSYNRAFCALFLDNDANAHTYYEYQDPVNQLIKTGQNFDCDFFNVMYVPAAPTTVYLNKHNCPAGFDAASADISGLAAGCNAPVADPVSFTLLDLSGSPQTAGAQGGLVSWQKVATGAVTITETPPSGVASARAFCNTKNSAGDESGFAEVSMANFQIGIMTKAGYDTYCDWYDIPPAAIATATATAPPPPTATEIAPTETPTEVPPTGTAVVIVSTIAPAPSPTSAVKAIVIIYDRVCPSGYDPLAENANPEKDCTGSAANTPFTLTGPNGVSLNHKVGPAASSWADFHNLDGGRYLITETMKPGVTSAFIDRCISDRDLTTYPFTPFAQIGSNGRLVLNLRDQEKLTCFWYDIPAKQSGGATPAAGTAVKVTVLACPGQSVNLAQCQPAKSGVQFTLSPSGGSGQAATLQTDGGGIASGQVPPGTYTLAEVGGAWCLADSPAFDANANLTVADQEVDVTIYNCGA